MANITRIKNNQITDSTITYHKIVPGTLIGSLFNADLTLNSNVSIIGNLSVAGSSSSVTSTNTYVNDPLVVFNNGYTGSLTGYDIGILVNRNLASLPGYGSVNTAWVWSEADQAFISIATTNTGAGITNLNNSGYANVIVGNITAYNLTLSGSVYADAFHGDIYATNGVITNFSTANALITGGTITGLTDLGATTGVITNFSTGNAQITGGSITGLTYFDATTLHATNLSTANALITGGSITGVNGGFSTLVATNFSTANAQITGGSITGITEFGATTLHATNFSTGNAVISGGYIDNTTIGFNQAANGYFSELHASGTTYLASGEDNNGLQYTSGALQVTGGVGISGNLYVQGNLFVSNIISANTSILSVTEPLLYLTADNPSNYNYEVGFYSHFIDAVYQHTGLVRDHNDYVWKLFSNVPEPVGSTVNFTNAIWDKLKLGEMFVANTTSSNSSSSGALVVSGGAGIGGNLVVGGNLFVNGNIKLAAINETPIGNVTPSTGAFTYLTATTGFSTSNALVTGGSVTGLTTLEATTGVITNFSTGNAVITGGSFNGTPIGATTASTGSFTALSATGFTYFSDTTEAITSNIGSVVMAGGLAVNKQIMVGGNLVATSTTGSTTYNTGSFVTKGGAGIAGDVYVNKGVVVNENNGANDFVAKGVNSNTLLWARSNGTYDQVLIGDTTATGGLVQGAKLQLASTDSIILPTGSTAERPGGVGYTDTIGMIRFNTTIGSVEWYNGSQWKSGATPLTVIADQQFSGDGSTVDFTLSQAATTNGVIVSINGVVQIPTLAYAVGGVGNTTLSFTEAPENGDLIDVRFITSSQTITSLASSNGIMQLVFQNTGINLYTGSGSSTNTTSWTTTGAQVSKIPATTIASSGVATTIDTFDKATYRTAKYVVQATYSGTYHSQEALVVHDGTTATIVLGTAALTSGSLGTISATISGSNVVLQFTAGNSGTDVRIKKDYIIL